MNKIIKNIIFVVACIAALFVGVFGSKLVLKLIFPLRYSEHIEKYSNEYGMDKYLVMSLIKVESNYIYDANSGVAKGLMQLTDETANSIGPKLFNDYKSEDIFNPERNIKMGCYYMNYLSTYYKGNIKLVLAAYNAGMGNVDEWLKDPAHTPDSLNEDNIPFEETKKYLPKIEKTKSIYKKLYK